MGGTPRVLVTAQFLHEGDDVDRYLREQGCEVVYSRWNGPRRPGELESVLADVDGVVAAGDPYTADVLDAAPRLRVIARCGVGYDSIDVEAATARGIAVCNMPGVNRISVAEMTIALLLLCARHIPANLADVAAGNWRRIQGRELHGATLGLIGAGAIGKAVAERAAAFGMRLVAYDPHPDLEFAARTGLTFTTAEEVLAASDFLSLHLFLNDANRHWLNAERLALMKPTAYVVNTSRGPVVDETALAAALRDGTVAGAALDVVEVEPLRADNPLRGLPNCHITPHLGGTTDQARARSGIGAARNVVRVLKGEAPEGLVNPSALAAR
ncbi:phosphoglycerate dehydrogenase [Nocardiopsis sediminis]|uniref:Phosphoglycerate dehydrogenase n=1 Tax=Nocardiopsis sediminis TaxID=1778267 RepID=A0ABV8FT76_9ACTN